MESFFILSWKVCAAPAEQELASNFVRMDRDVYTPDLIAASDCMLGKSLHSEANTSESVQWP